MRRDHARNQSGRSRERIMRSCWKATGLMLGASLITSTARGQLLPRVTPDNARPIPGVKLEYPETDRVQKRRIVEEIVAASLGALVHQPLASTSQIAGRFTERMLVRRREALTWLGAERPFDHIGRAGDGLIDGPFGSPLLPARLTMLPSSESAIQGLLGLIARSRQQFDLMMYGFEDDPTGREVANALETAARRGVAVRLLVDRTAFLIHNRAAAYGCPTFLDRLKTVPGLEVIETPGTLVRMDHRKVAVCDGRSVWSGSMILTEVARRQWENLSFVAEGPIVAQYAAMFEDRWREVGGPPRGPLVFESGRAIANPNACVRLVRTDVNERSLKNAVFHAVDHARDHIYLENPYFSDTVFAEKLINARQRGVDVRVILTLRGNVPAMNKYDVLTANRLLRGGVRVYLTPGMTHVKAITIDGQWSYVGSGNFDDLSLRNNHEASLTIVSPEIARTLEQTTFLPDLARSEELRALMPLPKRWWLLKLNSLWY